MSAKRKQVYLAVVGSVGIHLVALLAWAFTVQWFPAAQPATSQPPEQMKLEVVEATPAPSPPSLPDAIPTPTPTPRKIAFVTDTEDLPTASLAPKDATFESNRNSEAASQLPPTGDKPLPTQKGRKIPEFAFETHPLVEGDPGAAAGQNAPADMPPVAPPTEPPRPVPAPAVQPTPLAAEAAPTDPRDLAMVTPKSLPTAPADAEPNPYDPSFRPPASMTEPPRPTPVRRSGGYQYQQQRAESSGGIGKFGVSSVSAEATATGRYKTAANAAIQRVWYQCYSARPDVSLGTVMVHFDIDEGGKVYSPHVVFNTGNDALLAVTMRALTTVQIPPAPGDVVAENAGRLIPMDIRFNSISGDQ